MSLARRRDFSYRTPPVDGKDVENGDGDGSESVKKFEFQLNGVSAKQKGDGENVVKTSNELIDILLPVSPQPPPSTVLSDGDGICRKSSLSSSTSSSPSFSSSVLYETKLVTDAKDPSHRPEGRLHNRENFVQTFGSFENHQQNFRDENPVEESLIGREILSILPEVSLCEKVAKQTTNSMEVSSTSEYSCPYSSLASGVEENDEESTGMATKVVEKSGERNVSEEMDTKEEAIATTGTVEKLPSILESERREQEAGGGSGDGGSIGRRECQLRSGNESTHMVIPTETTTKNDNHCRVLPNDDKHLTQDCSSVPAVLNPHQKSHHNTVDQCPNNQRQTVNSHEHSAASVHNNNNCSNQCQKLFNHSTQVTTNTTTTITKTTNCQQRIRNSGKMSETDGEVKDSKPKPFSAIPGPWPSLPFVGTGWQYFPIVGRYDLNKLHEAHLAKFHDYGPIVREEYQWNRPMIHIFDPHDFETVFRSQGRCPVRPPNEFVTALRSSKPEMYPNVGFANLNGEPWLELRQKLAPGIMKMKAVLETITDQNCVLDDFLDYLGRGCDPENGVFSNIQEACYRLALESICLVCLGSRIGSFEREDDDKINHNNDDDKENDYCDSGSSKFTTGSRLIEATKLMFDAFNRLYYGPTFWKYFSTGAYSDLERSETELYEVASKYIEAEIVRLNNEPEAEQKYNVLQTLLATPGLSADDVKVTVIDFIAGGIFTVSNSLAYLCYHLATNPEAQQTLADEIERITGSSRNSGRSEMEDGSSEWISQADIAGMSYLKACVKESFRLNCPVPGIMRVTSKPLVLSGYEIPENTAVFSHIMSTCRLEQYFADADSFKPERWLEPEARSQIHPFASLPFGFGSRMCVGKRFSENEIYLAAARLVSRFRIELPDGQEPSPSGLELKHAFIVIPAKPIALKLTPR